MRNLLLGILSQSGYLLDTFEGAKTAYSLRKIKSDYAGYCIRVIRSSDGMSKDIGFTGNNLDISDLLTFVGTGDGVVDRWYDQSGSSNDAYSNNLGERPDIVNDGVFLEEIRCSQNSNAGKHLKYTTPFIASQPEVSIFYIAKRIAGTPNHVGSSTNAARNIRLANASANNLQAYTYRNALGFNYYFTLPTPEHAVISIGTNRANAYIQINTSRIDGNDIDADFTFNAESRLGSNGTNAIGEVAFREFIVYNSFQSLNAEGIYNLMKKSL